MWFCYVKTRSMIYITLISLQLRASTSEDGTPSVYVSGKTVRIVKDVDRKILLIPIMFFVLRIWGTIRFILYVNHYHQNHPYLNNIDKALILLQVIVG